MPTTIPASFIAGGRSTGTRCPSSSRSCSMNSPRGMPRARSGISGASTLTSSAGWTEPRRRACTIRRAPSSSGCSGRVDGSSSSTSTPRPAGREEPQLALAQLAAAPIAHLALDDHGLDAEALGLAGVAVDQRTRLLRREIHVRPDVEPHAVPEQALARRAAGLEAAQRAQRLGQHVLELGQRDDAPGVVADDRQLAHLGQGEQPLVLRVRAADAAEQVHVGGRRDALQRELRHAPQVQALGQLGVDELELAVDLPAAVERAPQRDRVRAPRGRARARGRRARRAAPAAGCPRGSAPRAGRLREVLARGRVGVEVQVDRLVLRILAPRGARSRPRRRRGPACPRTPRRGAGAGPSSRRTS